MALPEDTELRSLLWASGNRLDNSDQGFTQLFHHGRLPSAYGSFDEPWSHSSSVEVPDIQRQKQLQLSVPGGERSFLPTTLPDSPENPGRRKKVRHPKIPNGYACDKCEYVYDFAGELSKHKVSAHTPKAARKWGCDSCTERFNWEKDLKRHRIVHDRSLQSSAAPEASSSQDSTSNESHQSAVSQRVDRILQADSEAIESLTSSHKKRRLDSSSAIIPISPYTKPIADRDRTVPFECATHRHETIEEVLYACHRDLKRFAGCKPSRIMITADLSDGPQPVSLVAKHEIVAVAGQTMKPPPAIHSLSTGPILDDWFTTASEDVYTPTFWNNYGTTRLDALELGNAEQDGQITLS